MGAMSTEVMGKWCTMVAVLHDFHHTSACIPHCTAVPWGMHLTHTWSKLPRTVCTT
jgi:hypothetical protein